MLQLVDLKKPRSKPVQEVISGLEQLEKDLSSMRDKEITALIHGKRISERELKFELEINSDYERRIKKFDSILEEIIDPELADYLIITNVGLFGKPDPEEIKLIKEYKMKYGSIKRYIN